MTLYEVESLLTCIHMTYTWRTLREGLWCHCLLLKFGYPKWALMDAGLGASRKAREVLFGDRKKCQGRVSIPYFQSVPEEIRRVLQTVNITTHFRPPSSLRQMLFHPKDKVPKGMNINVVYQVECEECGEK